MNTEELVFEISGPVARVKFNRPDIHNSMSFAMYDRLEEICVQISSDRSIRVLTLQGSGGKAFIAGTDISQFRRFRGNEDAIAYESRIEKIVSAIEQLDCTTIAVLEGVCAGGGVAIALACDFRYSNQALKFGIPVAKTLGNCIAVTNVARLIDHVGLAKTREILMLAKFLDTETCRQLGIVNDSFPTETLDQEVNDVIKRLLSLAPLTIRASKIGIRRTLEARRAPVGESEDLIRSCYASTDFHDAVDAFLEKRPYQWLGH